MTIEGRSGHRAVAAVGAALTVLAAFLLGAPSRAAAQASSSAAAVKQLAQALDAAKLDSIAAVDPAEPDVFAAALYFPGAQILVVSAKYSAPILLLDKIANKEYRDVYIDLNSASIAGTKVFVIDQGADGLVARPENEQPADSYENGSQQITFDGEWRRAKLSEDEYMKRFTSADERYARILGLLTDAVKSPTH